MHRPPAGELHTQLQLEAFGVEPPAVRERQDKISSPVVVEVRGVEKVFRVPEERVDTLRERVTRPFGRRGARKLHALRGVSFDVHKGEFFGIVGKNGSGKSTLLKILASIYRADRGHVRVAGTIAPFIELGVGFNPELTARENVALNGVMMGLSRREAQRRLDAILDFAELRDFEHLKLKNYSSGMLVRLAFSIMAQADPDIMLIDEVLAVGDAAFAQRCLETFEEKRRRGTTLILVTHDMATVQSFCDRATVLHHGQQIYTGEPDEAVRQYFRFTLGVGQDESVPTANPTAGETDTSPVDVTDARVFSLARSVREETSLLRHKQEEPTTRNPLASPRVPSGDPFAVQIVLRTSATIVDPTLSLSINNVLGIPITLLTVTCRTTSTNNRSGSTETGSNYESPLLPRTLEPSQRYTVTVEVANRFVPGRYVIRGSMLSANHGVVLSDEYIGQFVVTGTDPNPGMYDPQPRVSVNVYAPEQARQARVGGPSEAESRFSSDGLS